MNTYEEKRAARIERLRNRADNARSGAAAAWKRYESIASHIPMGQPILVGHHSEKRHRRDIQRIDTAARASVELNSLAADLDRRADHAESNRSISSDDPNAPDKLAERIAKLEQDREIMKAINKGLRSGKTDEEIAKPWNLNPADVAKRRIPDFAGRIGYPDYALTNLGANIRRLKQRHEALSKQATAETPAPEQIGDVRIEESENRVRVFFPGKPSDAVRAQLKSFGFKWSPTAGAWQRMASGTARQIARHIVSTTQVA
jgi:hypothetical protein